MSNILLEKLIRELVKETVDEKLELSNFTAYSKIVAESYINAPSFEDQAVPHWNALIQHVEHVLFPKIDKVVKKYYKDKNPEFTSNPDGGGVQFVDYHPYQNQKEMKDEVENKGIFRVSTADSDHPLWNPEQNAKFRAVHDWYTHIVNNADFSLRGELRAYNTHVKLLPPEAVPAAFTEIVGQACTAIVTGQFHEQKICLLRGFDYYRIGQVENYDIVNKNLVKKQ